MIEFADNIFKFFVEREVKAIVMACNTTSATAYEALKNKYDVKVYPIAQSCANVFANMGISKLGVFATNVTINSHIYKKEIQKYNPKMEVFELACPEWVKIVETNSQKEKTSKDSVKKYFDLMMKNNPEKIVLGCTHYPYLKDILLEIAGEDIFIDPATYFAQYIKNDLAKAELLAVEGELGDEQVFVSANPNEFKKAAEMFYSVKDVKLA